jgi:hypothetical protein
MPHKETHYGDEDPEFKDVSDAESEEEMFETAKFLGWSPEDMRDKTFAEKYKQWLKKKAE